MAGGSCTQTSVRVGILAPLLRDCETLESSYSVLSSIHEVNTNTHPLGLSQRIIGSRKGLRPGSQEALLAVIQRLVSLANVLASVQPTPPWEKLSLKAAH